MACLDQVFEYGRKVQQGALGPCAKGEGHRRFLSLAPFNLGQHLERGIHRHSHLPGPSDQRAHGLLANGPRRHVDDARQAHAIVGIVNQAQVGHHVLDLLALVEARRAHQLVGHAPPHKGILDRTRLGIGAVHDGTVPQSCLAPPSQALDLADHHVTLFLLVVGLHDHDLRATVLVGVESLWVALKVPGDDGIRHVEDRLRGAVVTLQQDDAGLWIVLAETGYVAVVGSPEAVDRLVFIAHHKEVGPLASQQLDQFVLGHVGVLPFVHQDKGVATLVLGPHAGILAKEPHRLDQQIVKVEGSVLGQHRLVALVYPLGHLLAIGTGQHLDRGDQFVLGLGDEAQHRPRAEELFVEVEGANRLPRQAELIPTVIDDVLWRDASRFGLLPQDARADGVKGANGQFSKLLAQQPVQALLHLTSSLVGKGHGHDLPWRHPVLPDQVGHPVS